LNIVVGFSYHLLSLPSPHRLLRSLSEYVLRKVDQVNGLLLLSFQVEELKVTSFVSHPPLQGESERL
jgi:hypothetical protein